MKKLVKQFMRFGVVGLFAFIIDYGLMVFLTEVFSVNYLISATLSFTASVVFNYYASMRYVFSRRQEISRRREFIVFVSLSIAGLLLNNVLMWAGVEKLAVDYRIVKLGVTVIVSLWNFITRKIFLEERSKDAAGSASYG